MKLKNWSPGIRPFILIFCVLVLVTILILRGREEASSASLSSSPAEGEPAYATLRLAVAGDLVAHDAIHEEARREDGSFDFRPIMESVRPITQRADISVVCLEAALMESGYLGYPMFKSPDALAEALAYSGFDLVSTASNHALDGLGHGLVRTLDVLEKNGLSHVGTYRTYDEWAETSGIIVVEKNGISIAFLAYTYGTNAININSVGGHSKAVNVFTKDYLRLSNFDIDYERLGADMAVARMMDTDLIAVFMHWGTEYKTVPESIQIDAADFLIMQGADLILGGHPHVPQPLELRSVSDSEGNTRNIFLNYCMGNFISSMNDENTKLTGIAEIEIKKDLTTNETSVESASYVPFYMADLGDFEASDPDWRYKLLDLHAAIDTYEEKAHEESDTAPINHEMYRDMLLSLDSLHRIFGKKYDSYYDDVS